MLLSESTMKILFHRRESEVWVGELGPNITAKRAVGLKQRGRLTLGRFRNPTEMIAQGRRRGERAGKGQVIA